MGVKIRVLVVVILILEYCHHLVVSYNGLSQGFDTAIFVDDDAWPATVLIAKAFRILAECVRELRTLSSLSDKISLNLLIVWRVVLPYVERTASITTPRVDVRAPWWEFVLF